jgi:hypothetical protein
MTTDWVMVFAVLAGPVLAVQATRLLDMMREGRARRLHIFRVLMATRAAGLSPAHVEALNLIDVEFDKVRWRWRDRKVIEAWRAYLAHLGDRSFPPDQWPPRRMDLLVDLLYAMSQRLRYRFDKTHIKTSVYSPVAHGEFEDDTVAIRKCFRELLEFRRPLPMHITNWPQQAQPEQIEAQDQRPAAA